ncbi:hypothetical protein [Actinoplanes sp. NPDC026623]|uniref:hypothetical protein n=1 Tax=Actinoplanes sp. NPDC026623 TaxID=3155610 RepID=UPI0033C5A727
MIDLDATDEPQPRRRSRIRIYVAVAVAAVLVAGAATAYLVHRYAGTEVRFEVESASGKARQIQWDIGITHFGRKSGNRPGESFPTPWSQTVMVDDWEGIATLRAMSTDADDVTCRIVVEGKVISELTHSRLTGCIVGLDKLKQRVEDR